MAASYAISALDNYIREELPRTRTESLPEIAPVYKYIERSTLGVKRNDIGRDWEVEHLFATGIAGLIQSADVKGPSFYDREQTNYPFIQSLVMDGSGLAIFPTATSAPHTTSLKRILTLALTTGNFSIPVTWLSGDALQASQIRQVTTDIAAVGKNHALTEAISFFMSTDNALCQIDDYSLDSSNYYFTCTVKAGTGRTAFFRVGQMVDVMYNNSGTPNWGTAGGTNHANVATANATAPWGTGYIPLIVSDVDYIGGTVTITSCTAATIDGSSLTGSAIADDDWIVMASCGTVSGREMRTWGIEDWTKSSGQVMGGSGTLGNRLNPGLDLDSQSQFKSQVAAVNGPLTDIIMNGYVGGFLDAYPGASIDTIITTMGVTLKYLEQPELYNNRMFYDRTGKALDVKGGWDDVSYSFNGRSLRWMTSNMCISQRFYALKLNNGNVKRYVPPRVGGSNSEIGAEVEFIAPLAGHSNIFKIAHSSGGATQAVLEAPFWEYHLVCPIDIRGVKLTGLTEATMS